MNGPTIRYWHVEWPADWIRFGRIGDKLNQWDIADALCDHEEANRKRERKRQYKETGRAPVGGWTR